MLYVFNKQKIYTYLGSIIMVILLFCAGNVIRVNKNTVETVSKNDKILPIYNVKTDEKKVAFTMNCAWSADDINKILEVLKKSNVKITFFMVGDWIKKYPDAAKKIYSEGHEIASHSNTHPHVNNLSYEKNINELEKCNEKIKEITGKDTLLYRTPYGEYNNTVMQAALDKGYNVIQWDLDTLDYTGINGEEMWNRIKDKIKEGDIILSHNGTKYTAESLEMLINNINQKGFKVVKVSDLIYKDNYIIDNNGTQVKK